LRHSAIDSVDKNFLFSKLGNPNKIQKFSQGGKNYIGYIYYVYKDNCPKVQLEAFAIQFIFDEFENNYLKYQTLIIAVDEPAPNNSLLLFGLLKKLGTSYLYSESEMRLS
jgi:hypothetical protein